ncbi:Protein EVA-1 a [Aphelenchoides avenae]|nr:Protein EVA-1 a [Aphelenchus avenae]
MTASLYMLIPLSLISTTAAFKSDIVEALMVESLRNNLVQACDNEKITLHCPRNTHIMLENVFYGRLVPSNELCPVGGISGASIADEDTSCDVSEARMKISELCRNKRKCRIHVKASFFDRDPCPSTSKYLQISYKCKPISFEDQNFCEGSTMQLSCKQNKRLSVYSAHYGRTVNGQAMHCALGDPVREDGLKLPNSIERHPDIGVCVRKTDVPLFRWSPTCGFMRHLSTIEPSNALTKLRGS